MAIDFFILLKQELSVCVIIILLLFIKVIADDVPNTKLLNLVNFLLLINCLVGFIYLSEGSLFNNMFHTSNTIAIQKNILNIATYIVSLIAWPWLKKHEHVVEFYMLLLCTLLGMFFMISSRHVLMFYVGLELSGIPLAALANFDLDKRKSAEAAFKFIISSAFSSGLLLFGISLLYGTTGTLLFAELPQLLNGSALQIFAFILIVAGFAFKISVVPFHFWTADVYEGSPAPVTAYFSVVSKAAVIFIFMSVLYTVFKPLESGWFNMLVLLSLITIIIGNLFAIRQNNIKRFFAFSSIAQVGFILIGMGGSSQAGFASVIFFVLIYVFSNLAAFAVITLVSSTTGKETIDAFKGFYKTNPLLSWMIIIALFSLAGVPPTAGFFGKYFLLLAGAEKGNYVWIAVAALNLMISFYYYLRIVKAIFMDENELPLPIINIPLYPKLGLYICCAGIILTGVASWIYEYIFSISKGF